MKQLGVLQEMLFVESHRNTSKHQKALGSRSRLLFPYTLQTVLRSSNTDFVKKVTKTFLPADISLYEQSNKHTDQRDGVVFKASASQSVDLGFIPLVESFACCVFEQGT